MAAKKPSTKATKKTAKKPAPRAAKKPVARQTRKPVGKAVRRPVAPAAETPNQLAELARQTGLPEAVVLERALAAFATAHGLGSAPAPVKLIPPPPAPVADEPTYPDDSQHPALGPDVRLYVHPPGRPPQEMIADTFVIGASSRCDLTLKYPTVEMRHVRIVREGRRYFAEDLDTTKGTVIHGQKITRYELAHEDDMYLAGFLKVRVYLLE